MPGARVCILSFTFEIGVDIGTSLISIDSLTLSDPGERILMLTLASELVCPEVGEPDVGSAMVGDLAR